VRKRGIATRVVRSCIGRNTKSPAKTDGRSFPSVLDAGRIPLTLLEHLFCSANKQSVSWDSPPISKTHSYLLTTFSTFQYFVILFDLLTLVRTVPSAQNLYKYSKSNLTMLKDNLGNSNSTLINASEKKWIKWSSEKK